MSPPYTFAVHGGLFLKLIKCCIKSSVRGRYDSLVSVEEERYAPESGKSYDNVDYSGENRRLPSAYPGYDIKREKPYASPVERAYDRYEQRDFVHEHIFKSFFFIFIKITVDA